MIQQRVTRETGGLREGDEEEETNIYTQPTPNDIHNTHNTHNTHIFPPHTTTTETSHTH